MHKWTRTKWKKDMEKKRKLDEGKEGKIMNDDMAHLQRHNGNTQKIE